METKKPSKIGNAFLFILILATGILIGKFTNSDKVSNTNDSKTVNSLMKIIEKKDSCLLFTRELLKKEKKDSRKKLDSLVDVSSEKVKMDSSLYMKGLVEGKKVGRKVVIAFIQKQHRNLPESKKDSFLFADKANRVRMLPDWSISFTHLHYLFPEWKFLDTLYQIYSNAKVLPIYIADTLGSTSVKKQRYLSIIPLEDNEYLIYRGKNEEAAGYYQEESNMIVLRDNHMDTSSSKYSFWNASILLHELCHYYLTHKKYRGNEHEYIKQVLYLLHDKIENLYPGKSPEEAEALFEERKEEK
jgi:hypothetical protein